MIDAGASADLTVKALDLTPRNHPGASNSRGSDRHRL